METIQPKTYAQFDRKYTCNARFDSTIDVDIVEQYLSQIGAELSSFDEDKKELKFLVEGKFAIERINSLGKKLGKPIDFSRMQ